ncbi:hypothetical protein ACFL2T_08085, partial [Elusimicrobiota bacterium]
ERTLKLKKKLGVFSNTARYQNFELWAHLIFAAARVDLMDSLKEWDASRKKPPPKKPERGEPGAEFSPRDILESLESE